MSAPFSQPVIPAQPHVLAYGIQDLGLFSTYSRDSYLAAFGVQAPAWDPARVRKAWFDSTVDTSDESNLAVYKVISQDQAGTWALRQLVMPTTEAASVNLPGAVTYPPYVVAPTQATVGGSGVGAQYLSLEADAGALMTELGASGMVQESFSAVFPVIYPANEPRRLWDFVFKGALVNAGALLLSRGARGSGSPGHWDLSGSEPLWVADAAPPTGLNDMRLPRSVPVRDLLPNERLQNGLMGVSVVRTDLQQEADQQAGKFTADDRATLQQIYRILQPWG